MQAFLLFFNNSKTNIMGKIKEIVQAVMNNDNQLAKEIYSGYSMYEEEHFWRILRRDLKKIEIAKLKHLLNLRRCSFYELLLIKEYETIDKRVGDLSKGLKKIPKDTFYNREDGDIALLHRMNRSFGEDIDYLFCSNLLEHPECDYVLQKSPVKEVIYRCLTTFRFANPPQKHSWVLSTEKLLDNKDKEGIAAQLEYEIFYITPSNEQRYKELFNDTGLIDYTLRTNVPVSEDYLNSFNKEELSPYYIELIRCGHYNLEAAYPFLFSKNLHKEWFDAVDTEKVPEESWRSFLKTISIEVFVDIIKGKQLPSLAQKLFVASVFSNLLEAYLAEHPLDKSVTRMIKEQHKIKEAQKKRKPCFMFVEEDKIEEESSKIYEEGGRLIAMSIAKDGKQILFFEV